MKKILLVGFCIALALAIGAMSHSTAIASDYGIYGTVTYAGESPDSVIDNATVQVYKYIDNSWVHQGSTVASACGYYTYDTGSRGNYKAVVDGDYYLRDLSPCLDRTGYEHVEGVGYGTVTWLNPQVRVDVPTA